MKLRLDPIRQKLTTQTYLVILAATLFILLLIVPKSREIYRNQRRLIEIRNKIDTANDASNALPGLSKDLVKIKQLLKMEKRAFILPDQVGSILLVVDKAMEGLNADLTQVTPDPSRLSAPFAFSSQVQFQLFPVHITLKGSYRALTTFLHQLTSQNQWVLLDSLTISNPDKNPHHLHADIKVAFFIGRDLPREASLS